MQMREETIPKKMLDTNNGGKATQMNRPIRKDIEMRGGNWE